MSENEKELVLNVSEITDITLTEMLNCLIEEGYEYVSIGRRKTDGIWLLTVVLRDGRKLYASSERPLDFTNLSLELLRHVLYSDSSTIADLYVEQRMQFLRERPQSPSYSERTNRARSNGTETENYPF